MLYRVLSHVIPPNCHRLSTFLVTGLGSLHRKWSSLETNRQTGTLLLGEILLINYQISSNQNRS
jgi:hypothetical protein